LKKALRARCSAIFAKDNVAAVFATGGCNGRAGAGIATGGGGHNGSAIVILVGFIGGASADGATRGGVAMLTGFEGYAFAACCTTFIDACDMA